MRVVSLAPSVTETLVAMNQTGVIVGRTSHSTITEGEEIGDWLNPDIQRVKQLEPDVVFTSDALQDVIREQVQETLDCQIIHQSPRTLSEVIESFKRIGRAIDRGTVGRRLAHNSTRRLQRVSKSVDGEDESPVVYCEEWHEPPMVAGNWVPDAVRRAGGTYPFAEAGERSHRVKPEEVTRARPDYAVLHICGRGRGIEETVIENRDWNISPEVHVFNDSLLNQPSPLLVQGVERLAEMMHDYHAPDSPVTVTDSRL